MKSRKRREELIQAEPELPERMVTILGAKRLEWQAQGLDPELVA
jgi:hypothetical protein